MHLIHTLKSRTILLLLLGCYPFSAISSETTTPNIADNYPDMSLSELMDLEVFNAATRIPIKYAKAPGTVYKFNRNDFNRFGVRRLEELLQYVPGLQLNQYRKRHRSIWARGVLERYNDKIVLVVDGIQRRHLYYSHFSLGDELPIENIESVEIIVGPASSLYGANAFAGLISITTRGFSEQATTELSTEIADNQRSKVTAQYSNDKFQLFGSYLDQNAAYDDKRKSFIGFDTQQPTAEYYGNAHLKTQLLPNLLLGLDYQNNKTPFLYIPSTQQAYIDTRSMNATLEYKQGDLEQGLLEIKGYYSIDRIREFENEQQTSQIAYQEQQDGTMAGLSLIAFKNINAQHLFSIGLSWEYDQADNFDFTRYWHFRDGFFDTPQNGSLLSTPDIENHNFALFFQDIWTINDQIDLTISGRYDEYEAFGGHFNYRAALVYAPTNDQVVKLLYGTATRTPTYREYLKVLDSDFIAPTPDPEEMQTIELSYQHKWEKLNFTTTLFHNQFEKYIQEVQTPDGEDEYFANSDEKWKMAGIELLLQYRPIEKLNIYATLAYVNAEISGMGSLPYIANWTSSLHLDYNYYGQQHMGLGLTYNSEREDSNNSDTDNSDAFSLLNIQLRGKLNQQLDYTIGVNNLLNKKVYDPAADFGSRYNTERTEREIWAQLTMKFEG